MASSDFGDNIENVGAEDKNKPSKLKEFLSKVLKSFKNALFPLDITCDACGEELIADTRYRLCSRCVAEMVYATGHRCLSCGMPLVDEADYCNRCQNTQGYFVKNRSPLVYDGVAKRLIYTFKFGKKQYIAQTLGAFMVDEYLQSGMNADIIVFVPMTKKEEKKRGFNQSELLAYEVGGRLNIPVLPALQKVRDTGAQKKLTAKDRAKNLEDAFVCVFDQVKNRNILLVDDIFTTGATANECSKTLLKAKARQVFVLTSAITVKK